jgi:hypothetical protein
MATVKGPLFSVDASGQVAGAIVFTSWKGRNVVRRHAVPANPRSGGQLSVRAMMKFLAQYWASLTSAEQTDWDARAAAENISPFNAFVSYNMARWGTNLKPSKLYPATEDNTVGTIDVFTATAQSRAVLITVSLDAANDNWGILIYRGLTDAMGITRNELVQVIPAEAIATYTWLDFPLTPAVAQYYRALPFDDTGLIGAAEDDITATPTT